jgi:hypothetical protein
MLDQDKTMDIYLLKSCNSKQYDKLSIILLAKEHYNLKKYWNKNLSEVDNILFLTNISKEILIKLSKKMNDVT